MAKSRRIIHYEYEVQKIPVLFFKEGKSFVAYSPVLDLSTCGDTFDEAKQNFGEALHLVFESCLKHGTLEEMFRSYGWERIKTPHPHWEPPLCVSQGTLPVQIPIAV